ncbi:MAG: O-antigen ligase family protein [Acidimicrobiales bacterium]
MPTSQERPAPIARREHWALIGVALSPVVFLPGALDRFVFPKVAVMALVIALAAACQRRGRLPRPVVGGLVGGAVLLVLAAVFSVAPVAALVGRAPRYEGVFVLPVYIGSAAAGAWLLGPGRSRHAMPWWLKWLALAVVAVAIEAVLESFGLRPLSSDVARPGSLLGNASDEGAYGVLCFGLFVSVAVRVRDAWSVVGAGASLAVVVLSASRGALVGAVAALVVLGVLASSPKVRLVVAGGLVVLAAFTFAVPATRDRVVGASPLAGSTVSGRTLLWQETLHLVAAHPLLGVGPNGFLDAIPADHDLKWQTEIGPANPPDSPHDWVLQAAAAGGVPLAFLACALAAEVVRRGRRTARCQTTEGETAAFAGILAGAVGYGVALLFHLTSPGTTPLAAFFCGALVAVPAPAVAKDGLGRLTRGATVAGAGLLCVILGLAAIAEIPLRAGIVAVSQQDYGRAAGDFAAAGDLRPWDGEITETEAHAFVVAAEADAATGAQGSTALQAALRRAGPAARSELADYPDSVEALEDLSTVEALSGDLAGAERLLARTSRLDPDDPQVLLSWGVVEGEQSDYPLAIKLLSQSAAIDKSSPSAWQDLAVVYRAEGNAAAAAAASTRARTLGGSAG